MQEKIEKNNNLGPILIGPSLLIFVTVTITDEPHFQRGCPCQDSRGYFSRRAVVEAPHSGVPLQGLIFQTRPTSVGAPLQSVEGFLPSPLGSPCGSYLSRCDPLSAGEPLSGFNFPEESVEARLHRLPSLSGPPSGALNGAHLKCSWIAEAPQLGACSCMEKH